MNAWTTVLVAFGGNLALLGVLAWLGKSLLGQFLAKDIENFKASLKSEAEAASQQLRHELEIATIEHRVRFSSLHEKRAEVIAELYGLLVQAYWDLSSFVSPMEWAGEPDKKDKYATAMNSVADFYRFFGKHQIYLPADLCKDIDNLIQEMRSKAIGFGVYVPYDNAQLKGDAFKKKQDAWQGAWKYFEENVPETKSALEAELRDILEGAANKGLNSDAGKASAG